MVIQSISATDKAVRAVAFVYGVICYAIFFQHAMLLQLSQYVTLLQSCMSEHANYNVSPVNSKLVSTREKQLSRQSFQTRTLAQH